MEMTANLTTIYVVAELGVDLSLFWEMSAHAPWRFFGNAVSQAFVATAVGIFAFASLPTAVFCESSNPCTCSGGGFEIYGPFCNSTTTVSGSGGNNSGFLHNLTTVSTAYARGFSFLGGNERFIVISTIAGIGTQLALKAFVACMLVPRELSVGDLLSIRSQRDFSTVVSDDAEISDHALKRAREQLDNEQKELLQGTSIDLSEQVDSSYVLDLRDLVFDTIIGQGSFGDCFAGTLHTGFNEELAVAIKRMGGSRYNKEGFAAFAKEVFMLSTLKHKNIVKFLGYSTTPALLIVMELAPNGTLADYVAFHDAGKNPPPPGRTTSLMLGTARALCALHANKRRIGNTIMSCPVVHRDIKLENVFLDGEIVRGSTFKESYLHRFVTYLPKSYPMQRPQNAILGDFGEAAFLDPDTMEVTGRVGTVGYVAPEILSGKSAGLPADIYAFGILLYETVALNTRYEDLRNGKRSLSWDEIERRVVNDDLRPAIPEYMMKSVSKLIEMCWDKDPQARPSMNSVAGYIFKLQKSEEERILMDEDEMISAHVASAALTTRAIVDRMCRTIHGLIWTKLNEVFMDQAMGIAQNSLGSPVQSKAQEIQAMFGKHMQKGRSTVTSRSRISNNTPRALSHLFATGMVVASPDVEIDRVLGLLCQDNDDEDFDVLRTLTEVAFFGGCAPVAQSWPLLKEDIFVADGNCSAFFPITIAIRAIEEDEDEEDLMTPYSKIGCAYLFSLSITDLSSRKLIQSATLNSSD